MAALPANLFLVEAAMQHGTTLAKPAKPSQPPRRTFEERAQWTADLFLRLQQADAAKTTALDAQRKTYAQSHGRHEPAEAAGTPS